MKKQILVTLSLLLSVPAFAAEHVELKVEGLACQFCAQGLEKKLSGQSGISDVKVDMKTRKVSFVSDKKIEDTQITKIVEDAGYKVKEDIQHHPLPEKNP
jgi:copper chaperone CopZ